MRAEAEGESGVVPRKGVEIGEVRAVVAVLVSTLSAETCGFVVFTLCCCDCCCCCCCCCCCGGAVGVGGG